MKRLLTALLVVALPLQTAATTRCRDARGRFIKCPPPPPVVWTKCADENGTCYVIGTAKVRYGSSSTWLTKSVTGSIACNNATWGDPTPFVLKECDTDGQAGTAPTPTPTPDPTPTPPPPPAPSGSWTATAGTLQIGGYAFVKGSNPSQACCNGLIVKITGRWYDDVGHALPMWSAVYAADPSGNYPASNPYSAANVGAYNEDSIIAVAPAP